MDGVCAQKGGSLPTVQQLNGNASLVSGTRGVVGGLWSEWGRMTYYRSGFVNNVRYWTSEDDDGGEYYVVNLNYGAPPSPPSAMECVGKVTLTPNMLQS